ncbi:MAG: single-stranded-DNA-specific exonuclease C-terminal domain-containing protein, partial [Streptococcus sp.]|nr:single-stranded-DNA-specific exonuclease C-terminal domain-containing protein [Streptococcus sp.]
FNIRSKNASLPAGVPILDFTKDLPDLAGTSAVVVGNIPEDLEELRQIFQEHDFQAVYFKNEIAKAYYLTGYGSRDQYAKLYKTIYQYPEFDVRYKLDDLSHYLKIDKILLIKMIQIFDELDFVTIDNGVMTVNKEAEKRDIEDSQIFQDLKHLVKFQELMALGTPREIYDWLYKQEQ